MLVTPVNWYQSTSPLKLMIDRLVCADGGNPDPTLPTARTRQGQAARARRLGLSAPSRRPPVLRRRAWRRRGRRERPPHARDWLRFMHLVPGRSRRPSSTATSATGSPMRPATTRSTTTRRCRRSAQRRAHACGGAARASCGFVAPDRRGPQRRLERSSPAGRASALQMPREPRDRGFRSCLRGKRSSAGVG